MILAPVQRYPWLVLCVVVLLISCSYWISASYYGQNSEEVLLIAKVKRLNDEDPPDGATTAIPVSYFGEGPLIMDTVQDQLKKEKNAYEYARLKLGESIASMKDDPELQLVMRSLLEQIEDHDGMLKQRQQEAADLTHAVKAAITRLQNPSDCSRAKKLVCHLTWGGCGFGCLIHHTNYCLITALATGRVLVLSDRKWPSSDLVIKTFLKPLSNSCLNYTGPTKLVWEVDPTDPSPTLEISISEYQKLIRNKQPYNPPAVHSALAARIFSLAADPNAWWAGQFVGYLLRYTDTVSQRLRKEEENMNFSSPVVGVHVRRTDKIGTSGGGTTSLAFQVEEYMEQVERWFRVYEMSHNKTKRQIYLATDDEKILEECHAKYPEYTIFENLKVAQSAAKSQRSSEESLLGVIHDIHMLSLTNFVVCTHSSNICGLVYELLHFKHGQASTMLHSLDRPYSTYPYIYPTDFQALVDEPSTKLISGDHLVTSNVERNYFVQEGNNSYLIRTYNMRTKEKHAYPRYKIKQLPQMFNFSNFN